MGKPIKVYFLPFAGGSSYSYHSFVRKAPPLTNVKPIEIPGRGTRISEGLLNDIQQVVDDVYQQIEHELDEPYALFGHSMGTIIVYLLTHQLIRNNKPLPIHVFVSGAGGPSIENYRVARSNLTGDELIHELRVLGGCPEEILNDPKMMDLFAPIIRSDFKCVESFKYQKRDPFNIPITVFFGRDEDVTSEEADAWKAESLKPVEVFELPGKHFFIFEHVEEILKTVSQKLLSHESKEIPETKLSF